ncbi:MAG: hypothetical protein V9F04_16575 [Dermatophilaceae bacterium]
MAKEIHAQRYSHPRKTIYDTLSKGDVMGVFPGGRHGDAQPDAGHEAKAISRISWRLSRSTARGRCEYIPRYNRRLHGDEPVEYHHPDLASSLGETYGIIVYQEQIMRVARDFAGV